MAVVSTAIREVLAAEELDQDYLEYIISAVDSGASRDEIEELLPGLLGQLDHVVELTQVVLSLVQAEEPQDGGCVAVLAAPVVAVDFAASLKPKRESAAEKKAAKKRAKKRVNGSDSDSDGTRPGTPPNPGGTAEDGPAIEVTAQPTRFKGDLEESSALYGIDIHDLCIRVGDRDLLKDARLQLFTGRYGFVGQNGCGKSTLMRAMAQWLIPGFPEDVTVLVDQEGVGSDRFPVEEVLMANRRLQLLREEEGILAGGLEQARSQVAVAEILARRATAARKDAALHSSRLSCNVRASADYDLVRREREETEAWEAVEDARAGVRSTASDTEAAALLAAVRDRLGEMDEQGLAARASRTLAGLGFTEELLERPTRLLSGGWRMRVALAQAIELDAQVIMLDEPTNHLDWDSVLWLEKQLKGMDGVTLIIVSHDRAFLDNVCDRIMRLHAQQLTVFEGNYTEFEEARLERQLDQARMQERIQDKRDKVQAQITKMERDGRKANNENLLNQVASRRKKLGICRDKTRAEGMTVNRVGLERSGAGGRFKMNGDRRRWGAGAVAAWGAEAVVEEEPTVTMTLKAAEPLGYHGPVLQCRGVTVGYPGHRSLVQEFDLNIEVTSRIGLLGTNGSGKTSILSTIAKSLEPRGGEVFHYPRLGVGYFSQHQVEALPIKDTPLQFMASCSKGNEGVLRGHLASFGIGPGLVHHTIATLSGGEKTRLALAGITIKAPHVLLLDEPSNHLDLLTVQALGEALQGFQGGIVLVSHDRRLIDEVCKENYVVEDRQLKRCESLKGFLKKVARQSQ